MIRSDRIKLILAVAALGLLAACSSSTDAAEPATTAVPAATAAPQATESPSAAAPSAATFDNPGQLTFPVAMHVTIGDEWKALTDVPATFGFVHLGNPPDDPSQWWGPGIINVDGAVVHDPATAVSAEPMPPSRADFVPWPDDFLAYVAALPGVTVRSGPDPITIGGIDGTQLTVDTPPMHPLIWTALDTMWLGGGPTGVDPSMTRHYVQLTVDGHHLLFELDGGGERFDEQLTSVQALYDTIRFGS